MISSTNSEDRNTYSFMFSSPIDLNPPCYVQINFPSENYVKGMGLDYDLAVNMLIHDESMENVTNSIEDLAIKIYPPYLQANSSVKVDVLGLVNPNEVGGTANFNLEYKCGSFTVLENSIFGSIAITKPKTRLSSASLVIKEGFSNKAGKVADYRLIIVPSNDLSQFSEFVLVFPDIFDFTDIKKLIEDFPSLNPCKAVRDEDSGFIPEGSFYCDFIESETAIIIKGLTAPILKSSKIIFDIQGLKNPGETVLTDFFKVKVILQNSNHVYEFEDYIEGLLIRNRY